MIQKWTINILLGKKKQKKQKILAFPSFLQTVLLQSCVVLTPCQLNLLLLSLHARLWHRMDENNLGHARHHR